MTRVITPDLLAAAQRGFKTAFQLGLASTATLYNSVATVITSSASEETYGWLGDVPKLREWIGDRHIKGLESKGYQIKNRKFESTIGVERDDIEDDKLGLYAPRFQMMGNSAAMHPDEITFELMSAGATSPCYDGQNFFDVDHPVGKPGAVTSVANFAAGSSDLWILADLSKPLKPWIFQKRRDYNFTTKEDGKTSDLVFMRDKYFYGVDARVAAGYGFWQMAFGSTDTLDAANLKEAYEAMAKFTDDEGRKLNIRPTHLIVGSTNLFAAREILLAEQIGGTTNTIRNLVQVMEAPLLN
ncbi:Mu-like prophage major head subunit gpT [Neorhizobium galegae bv. officinalis bv. officinalis str. HAMBI 1141]|uniref:Mu-like prophage major head subunit gpT n=1 Tax=Neorhizobium galegae bv. officinalis bv. officinalis str. HAMBI 1141 TaxID=1028801 RepID=A0A068T898_NEOGA|nr:Mu-like prophage major head subunit gpT family protein [Neorhizobium galegae]CDN54752.1 Mu-like prophage major head subunit gpT [Neorhizobium galegae bv. officinalis bv. officinalis str. HAMBI 1141]